MFTAALFTIAKTENQPKCPSVIELDKENVGHILNEILCSHKNEQDCVPGAESYYPQQTNTGTENQTPLICSHL